MQVIDFWIDTMAASEEVMEIEEMTAEEAAHALTIGDGLEGVEIVVEIPKLLCMPRPKKDKQPMVPICMSP